MIIPEADTYYGDQYFAYQATIGKFGGWANRPKFEDFLAQDLAVLDFGCGGGYLLAGFDVRLKAGVEVNLEAAAVARSNGLNVYGSVAEVPVETFDVVISNHALEHVECPLSVLRTLKEALVPGGKMVCVVPSESVTHKYSPHDINQHLYTWSPMALGNLFERAGLHVLESVAYRHAWPPGYRRWAKFGRPTFDFACRVYGALSTRVSQCRVVAERRP